MGIDRRDSNDHLHTDVILSKITEYDIFRYYCPNFKDLGKLFPSDLREDRSPTVSIIPYNGKLLYKDFGHSDHTFDCFNYIKFKYNCTFIDSLRIIDSDFNLNLSSKKASIKFTMGIMAYRQNKVPSFAKTEVILKKRKRLWTRADANFWRQYLVSKQILLMFGVEPVSHFWVNSTRFTCKSITYAFRFKTRYKIYSPYEETNKWLSNTKKTDVQGYDQLPYKGERLIITSSLKDVMCLHAAGYNAIALQSEMQIPSDKLISELKTRFKTIDILYDNDFDKVTNPGQTMAVKICDLYGFNNICIPDSYQSKDPSDLVKSVSRFNELKNILNEQRRDY
jgi:hypothetical protein|tara:strand:+ start:1159 stop:2169 length:1011 start_codon:yes stop_codon:yes gene_type:complete